MKICIIYLINWYFHGKGEIACFCDLCNNLLHQDELKLIIYYWWNIMFFSIALLIINKNVFRSHNLYSKGDGLKLHFVKWHLQSNVFWNVRINLFPPISNALTLTGKIDVSCIFLILAVNVIRFYIVNGWCTNGSVHI